MPQPSGQVLVDSGHALAGTLFAYANDTGLWNATAGAMLSKTGTGAVVNEGGVNLATSDGSTWYTLASALTTSGDGTFTWRARKAAGATDAAGVVVGNHANVPSAYIWMRTAEIRIGGVTLGANASPTTLSTYSVVRTAGKGRFYKDGVFVNELSTMGQLSTLYVMNGIPASPTYCLNGAVEFFHAAIGKAFSDAEVAAFHADPYQILQVAGGADATAAGATVSATAAMLAGSASGESAGSAAGVTITAAASLLAGSASGGASSTITLTTPAAYRMHQRNVGTNTASVTISGTYTGSPGSIQYRFAGGAWDTLVASPSGGTFSQAVTLPTGQGALEVRFSSDTGVTASRALVGVGDVFIVAGQSNNVGVSPQIVAPVASAFTAVQYDRADVWKPLQEGDTQATSFDGGSTGSKGSYFGALSNRLQANGVPVAFVPCAAGSTVISSWERYDPLPTAGSTLYGRALQQHNEVGGCRALIWWQGESDATGGTDPATFQAATMALIDDWFTDTGTPTFLVKITNFHTNAPAIRAAQDGVIAASTHLAGWADGGGAYSGDVHYLTSAQINAVADAVYPEFVDAFYATSATASGVTITATASLLAGTASGMGSASAPGITLEAVAQLLAGIASGGSATTAAGVTLTATASMVAGSASGQQSASASGAVWSVLASLMAGSASNGSIVWPADPAGPTHRAIVPFYGVRAIVTAETIE